MLILGVLFLWLSCPSSLSQAQVPPITPSGLNTQVSGPIAVDAQTQYNITGGTRPGGGPNLFHSFGEFGVPTNTIANFLNETALPTSNILGRVTGGNVSNIFGTIQTEGFGSANLFLMNPAGFLFGPKATVNMGGMVAFTAADYIRLAEFDGSSAGIFHSNIELTSTLTSAPVAAFGFLGSNPAAIEVQGSQLTLATGKGLSLIGENITVGSDPEIGSPSFISVPSGQINLVSVASPGEILFPSLVSGFNINGQMFTTMGTVTILGGSTLDVSDNAFVGDGSGGTVRIRGGQFIMDGAFIFANTFAEANGSATAVSVNTTDDISLGNASAISAAASSTGRVGDVEMAGKNVRLEGGSFINTFSAESTEQGGNISINAESFNLASGSSIFSGSFGEAVAGNISIIATDSLNVFGFDPIFGSVSTIESAAFAGGNSGTVNVQSARMTIAELGKIGTTSFDTGQAGNLSIQTGVLEVLDGGNLASSGGNGSGNITISANEVTVKGFASSVERSHINNSGGGEGGTGNISIHTDRLLLTDDARIDMEGTGQLGTVTLSATESLTISNGGKLRMENEAGSAGLIDLFSPQITLDQGIIQTFTVGPGDAGAVTIGATDVHIVGAQINSGTCPVSCGAIGGLGGNVSIVAENSAQFSGQFAGRNVGGDIEPAGSAGIFTVTGNSGGNAGNITVMAPQIQITDGAMLSATSTGSGAAGNLTIQGNSPAQSVLIDGTGSGIFTDTQGTGAGGNISIDASQFALSNRATLSAQTAGSGNAGDITVMASSFSMSERALISAGTGMGTTGDGGNISVQADEVLLTDNVGIATNTLGSGEAGAIALTAQDRISLTDSRVNSSTFAFPGKLEGGHGGQITLHAPTIDISNGQIVSLSSSSGNAGNVLLETVHLTLDASELTASTFRSGNSGDITIRGLTDTGSSAGQVSFMGASQVLSETANTGNGGTIAIQTAQLMMQDNSLISTSSQGEGTVGNAGNVSLKAGQSLGVTSGSLIQSGSIALSEGNAGNVTVTGPAITLDAGAISTTTEFAGSAGTVMIKTNSLTVQNGGQIASSSVIVEDIPAGSAGNITIQGQGLARPAQSVLIDGAGSGIFTDTQGTGAGGNIALDANSVTLQNSAHVSSSSTGTGKAGDIAINAGNQFTMTNSSITTEADGASGGAIKITTNPGATVQLTKSMISASVLDGIGGGGSLSIDPLFFIMLDSQLLARAVQGPGGNISITTNFFLLDANSVISASSQFGVNGTITIQSPNAPVSGQIQPLNKTPLLATSLLDQRCAALAGGQFSSFTVAGRDSLPTEPGGWLASPLALAALSEGMRPRLKAEGGRQVARSEWRESDIQILSLRQIAPAGFLTQAFAVDWSAGCTS
jgi:filamentous hemagglutinin family protein